MKQFRVFTILIGLFFGPLVQAQTLSKTLNVQGYLKTSAGSAASGTFGMRFTFKKNGAAFPTACQIVKNSVVVTSGVFNATVDTATCNLASETSAVTAAAITVDIEVDFTSATFSGATSTFSGLPIYPVASALTAERANNIILTGANSQVLVHNGTAWTAGTVGTNGITNSAVTTAKLAAGAVDTNALGAGSVTSAKLAAGAVGTTAIGPGSVSSSNLGAGSVGTSALANDAVTSTKIAAGAVGTAALTDGNVTTAKFAAGAVDTAALGAGAVTSAKIAAGGVDTAALGAGAVTTAKIAASAVDATVIADGAISTAKIANSAVDLTTKVTGTLPLSHGGTGSTTGSITGSGATTFKAADGSTTTIGDDINANSATVIAGGSTGKIKLGTAGTAFQSMGVCITGSITVTNTAANQTCASGSLPASTAIWVHCVPNGAFTTPNTTMLNARPSGTANTLVMNTSVANALARVYTCVWMNP